MSNRFYCSRGHINAGVNGKKPNFCSTCSEKMTSELFKNINTNNHNNNNYVTRRPPINSSIDEDNYDINDIPELDGLSFDVELEVDNSNIKSKGFSFKDVAFSNPGQDISLPKTNVKKSNKAAKEASKASFKELMSNARGKTQAKEI